MSSGEAMLHIVLIDEDWDCSVTLRIFMADEAATKTGEFIEKAVQTSCVLPHLKWRLVGLPVALYLSSGFESGLD